MASRASGDWSLGGAAFSRRTGYSSLSSLRQLPIDHLKIDRSFISGDDVNGESQEIVKSIIALARSLGLTVIAEGVERQDQLDRLRGAGCDKAQGFMFSRPVDKDAALALLRAALGDGCGCGPERRRPKGLPSL